MAAPFSVEKVCDELRFSLKAAVERNLTEGILLSGGLDTSILAAVASGFTRLKAFTAALKNTQAPDVEYSKLVAEKFGLEHFIHFFGEDELYKSISSVVRIMKSFDPMEVRNSLTVYISLKQAKEHNVTSVMTGDGADELLAGYSFLFNLKGESLTSELQKMWKRMRFSSVFLAEEIGVKVRLPYLDEEFKTFAMKVPPALKVRSDRGTVWGKWVLRKAYEGFLPEEVVWRVKAPIEVGSGTASLPSHFDSAIPDPEFEEKKRKILDEDGVAIRSKEQLFYYEAYRSSVGTPSLQTSLVGEEVKVCPLCKRSLPADSSYCRTCGAYPV